MNVRIPLLIVGETPDELVKSWAENESGPGCQKPLVLSLF